MKQILILLLFLSSCQEQENKQSEINKLFDKATRADSLGDFKASIKIYNQILAIDTDYGGALVNRGRALISLGDTANGLIDLDNAIKYHPHERTYHARGVALLYLNKDLKKAEQDFLRAIAINKSFADSYYAMSMLKLHQGQLDESELYLKEGDKRGYNKAISSEIKTEIDKKRNNTEDNMAK